ncbi:hypothetical protein SEPCBS57363_001515 [Sporothrix epigloea]|uniref:Retrovirus-related Pol polyprotein from transposon TNT 1-94-like beta-barrel domain-containing protein n=1 Tax=Sporothrix epigloea TaxID=1892477 RepID=A0ABP0DDX3_9PEZI
MPRSPTCSSTSPTVKLPIASADRVLYVIHIAANNANMVVKLAEYPAFFATLTAQFSALLPLAQREESSHPQAYPSFQGAPPVMAKTQPTNNLPLQSVRELTLCHMCGAKHIPRLNGPCNAVLARLLPDSWYGARSHATSANSDAVRAYLSNPENAKSATEWYKKYGKHPYRPGVNRGQRSSSVPPSQPKPDQSVYAAITVAEFDATAFSVDAASFEPRFLVDSGANRHICNDLAYFTSFTAHKSFIRSLDTDMECLGWGSIKLHLKQHGGGTTRVLTVAEYCWWAESWP